MRVAVINETGTIGKTTVAAHLLAPRLRDAKLFAIGSVNQTTSDLRLESEKIGARSSACSSASC